MADNTDPRAEYKDFYTEDLNLTDSTKNVLINYSKIPADKLERHVKQIREKAWAIHPYPCIGMFRFIQLAIGQHALYKKEILPRMLTGQQNYLDLGCAFAQDVRRLVADGVPSDHCYGSDLRLDFLELGYELFNDRGSLKSRFIEADIFDADSPLKELYGTIDIMDASSFFHLFSYDEQKAVARSTIKLLRPQKDSLVVGRQVGVDEPGDYTRRLGTGSMYRHNIDSWRKMWDEVGGEVGVKFHIDGVLREVDLSSRKHVPSGPRTGKMMEFSVRRLG
ncbi:hypothetical protein LTR78_006633 [Recurvomyces mirabilis]|uniref:Methyltransferase domain-containing protein n=1 Tax=Recurvomyces mirabilis TaxID=574656 RepID=A0AAE1BZH7_9PEZI|nr:hypothetical protein LTR78_006633 [Recurvomyces mirabilis]KAK5151476.1 hypothetical protein LTS14_009320 [Recurvomyces mirabilis]